MGSVSEGRPASFMKDIVLWKVWLVLFNVGGFWRLKCLPSATQNGNMAVYKLEDFSEGLLDLCSFFPCGRLFCSR